MKTAPKNAQITPAELSRYVRVMRQGGVEFLQLEGLTLRLGPEKPPTPPREQPRPNKTHRPDDYQAMLYAATEGFPLDEPGQDGAS